MPLVHHEENYQVRKFVMGLNHKIRGGIDVLAPKTMGEGYGEVVR